MNEQLQEFARGELKSGLMLLPEAAHLLFKRMYSPDDLSVHIYDVVDNMPEEKLDWAMQQVQRSIDKQEK